MFNFVKSITLNISRPMYITCESHITSLLAVLILHNTEVYVYISSSDYNNITTYVERSINKTPCFYTILGIPNINLNHDYVGFGRSFDYLRAKC